MEFTYIEKRACVYEYRVTSRVVGQPYLTRLGKSSPSTGHDRRPLPKKTYKPKFKPGSRSGTGLDDAN